ncbi:MAG: ATP-binding protein [Coriobacteriia bacterium]
MWLYGPPGTGKTHLVTGAAIRTLEAGSARVERWLVSNLLRTLQEASRAGNGLEERIIRSLSECDLLLLDDLDLDRTSGFRRELLHEIADARWRNGRRTLVTSNKPPHEIAEGVGERVTSRLAGLCRVLHLEGPDGRRSRKESDAA